MIETEFFHASVNGKISRSESGVSKDVIHIFIFIFLYSIFKDLHALRSIHKLVPMKRAQNQRTASEGNYTPFLSTDECTVVHIVDNHTKEAAMLNASSILPFL